MKRLITVCLAIAALGSAVSAAEMTLDELLAAHFDAMGGEENLKAITTARFAGKMSMGPGMEMPFTMTFARPLKVRFEFHIQGVTAIQAYDGETAWSLMPFEGQTEPEVMGEAQASSFREQADLDGPLIDYEVKGNQVELEGMEEMESGEVYKLRVTMANGDIRHHYLDAETFLTIKQDGKANVQGAEVVLETILSDYRAVNGLLFPHAIESKPLDAPAGQVVKIDSIEIDADVDHDIFTMPTKVEIDRNDG